MAQTTLWIVFSQPQITTRIFFCTVTWLFVSTRNKFPLKMLPTHVALAVGTKISGWADMARYWRWQIEPVHLAFPIKIVSTLPIPLDHYFWKKTDKGNSHMRTQCNSPTTIGNFAALPTSPCFSVRCILLLWMFGSFGIIVSFLITISFLFFCFDVLLSGKPL